MVVIFWSNLRQERQQLISLLCRGSGQWELA
jgi:hypothetical protein